MTKNISSNPTKTYTYYVHQMHCTSCRILISEILVSFTAKNIKINLNTKKISFDTDLLPEQFLPILSSQLSKSNYFLSLEPVEIKNSLKGAFLISFVFLIIYLLLEQFGISKYFNPEKITYPAIFVLGLIASVSSCIALVGGLLLSLPNTLSAHLQFHFSRLASFFILGSLIGYLGQSITFSLNLHNLVLLLASVSMLLLGLSNLNIKNIQTFTLPNILGNKLVQIKSKKTAFLPSILGTLSFLLPCGFTQSIQLYSLSLASPISSAFTMLIFALGTLPVLGLISFTSHHFSVGKNSDLFQKTIGFILIYLALFNLKNLLNL